MIMRDKKNKHFTWKKYHRWFGLILSVFMLVFCVSGIILNHRQLFADCDVSRSILPPAYHIQNFNNGIIKGSIKASDDSVLAYGYGGIWLTDAKMKSWKDFNKGLPKNGMTEYPKHGADEGWRNLVRCHDGCLSLQRKGMEKISITRQS